MLSTHGQRDGMSYLHMLHAAQTLNRILGERWKRAVQVYSALGNGAANDNGRP